MKHTTPPKKTQKTPKYESRTFMGVVVLRDKTLANGNIIKVKDIEWSHPQYRQWEIDKFSVGDKIASKVSNLKRIRSQAQNDYMHLYFSLIAMSHGHGVEMEDVKNWAKGKCLAKGIKEVFGDKTRKVKSTSKLTVLEMVEFVARVEVVSKIPTPDPTPFNLGITLDEFNSLKQEEITRYKMMKPAPMI